MCRADSADRIKRRFSWFLFYSKADVVAEGGSNRAP